MFKGRQSGRNFSTTARSSSGFAEPAVGAVSIGPNVVLVARPLDSNRAITAVRFLLDGQTLAEAGPPGRYVWDTRSLRPGRHVVQVQAFSDDQFVGLSAPLAVFISPVAQSGNAASVALSFSTYEIDPRRAHSVAVPRLPAAGRAAGSLRNAAATPLFIEPASTLRRPRPAICRWKFS